MVWHPNGRRSRRGISVADTFRSKLASLPFTEKIKILEQLRERERLIAPVREKLKVERLREQQEKQSK